MGSFIGHVIPGSFFIIAAVWWILRSLITYYRSFDRSGSQPPFRCTVTFSPRCCRFPRVDWEALFVVLAGAIGIFVEIVAACFMRGMPVGMNNMQHATMYFMYGLAGFVVLMSPVLKRYLPNMDQLTYVFLLLAYLVEAVLFKFHLFGREGIDVLVHTLLVYTLYSTVICIAIEMKLRDNVLCVLARGMTTLIQGTWFWHVAFILYNPLPGAVKWDEHNHMQMMLVSLVFSWHIAGAVLFVLLCAVGLSCYYRRRGVVVVSEFAMGRTVPYTNGYAKLANDIDVESETLIAE